MGIKSFHPIKNGLDITLGVTIHSYYGRNQFVVTWISDDGNFFVDEDGDNWPFTDADGNAAFGFIH